jgi:RNA polymerase sigma-70 factor (ECF subfamily)
MTKTEEQILIRKAAAGDKLAAEAFIKAHQRSLYAYLLRMSGRSDVAEDVTQEAFVRVLTNLDRFDPRFRFSTWLFTIARRLYLNFCEKRRPICAGETMGAWASTTTRPEIEIERHEHNLHARDSLQRALMTLSLEQREVIVLFHQLEWPIWLISDHLGMPEGTVKSHLHRGRRRLRDSIAAIHDQTVQVAQEAWL